MPRSWRELSCGLAVAASVVGLVLYAAPTSMPPSNALRPDDPALVAEGKRAYETYCANCHGLDLAGQPNWQQRKPDGRLPAPPHDATGHTWHHPDATLFALTKHGSARIIGDPTYPSDMPAFGESLSDHTIVAALSYIKSTWPDAIRERHDRMNADARRN